MGGGRTLDSLQRADLFGPSSASSRARLIAAIRQILGDHRTASDTTSAASPALGERVILATGYGDEDIGRKADELAERLPEALAPLARIAYNYRWSWHPAGEDLFRSIDADRWQPCEKNPVRLLQEASGIALARAAGDRGFLAAVTSLEHAIAADLTRPPAGSVAPQRPIAMMCAEYGVHQSLPNYFGGLGALAGDFLKEASDRALPLVAVGLMYRQRFRQHLDVSGWQHESWTEIDPEQLPAALVRAEDGRPLTITVSIRGRDVRAQIWRVAVGRVGLFLLDADVPENGRLERWITSQLHVGDPVTRLSQYALLGVGGMRALAALGIEPSLVHLNKGHAAFAVLELARRELALGASVEAALEAARQRTVFTTHTPVAAGNETYPREDVIDTVGGVAVELGVDPELLMRLGRYHPEDSHEPFGMTTLSLRMSRSANGVSRRHGAVARGAKTCRSR